MSAAMPFIAMAVASFAMSQFNKPSMPSLPTLEPPPPPPEPVADLSKVPAPVDTTTPGEVAQQRRKAIAANAQYSTKSILGLEEDIKPVTDVTKAVKLGI